MSDAEKPKLTPANENPWYCLATLYGEQPEDRFDLELAARNRTAWNRFMSSVLSDEDRKLLVEKGFGQDELSPFSESESVAVREVFAGRIGDPSAEIPNLVIGKTIDFSYVNFNRFMDFSRSLFSRPVTFGSSSFSSIVRFRNTVFFGFSSFHKVCFLSEANFWHTSFLGSANFDSATFSKITIFTFSVFNEYTNFSSSKFLDFTHFRSALFFNQVLFINSEFKIATRFIGTHFNSFVPDFRGAKMHEATEFHDVKWPDPPSDREQAQDQVYAYERLKLEMERLKKHEDELFFFAKELRARQELPDSSFGARLLNYFYDLFSGYGLRMDRPLYWLLGLFLLGGDVFLIVPLKDSKLVEAAKSLGALPSNGETMLTFSQAAGLSFANIFSILPLRKELVSEDVSLNLNWVASAMSGAQMIFGALLLFLLGLALRNRFRMK